MKKGFTLAEVLITLAIIGVVAALTIPVVISNYNKQQWYTRFMKAYNTLSTAFNLAVSEYGNYNSWPNSEEWTYIDFANNTFGKYLKIGKGCAWDDPDNFYDCVSDEAEFKFLSDPDGAGGFSAVENPDGAPLDVVYILQDGTYIAFFAQSPIIRDSLDFIVDTNGVEKGPNTMGRDVFLFSVVKVNNVDRLVPFGIYDCGNYDCNANENPPLISKEDIIISDECNPNIAVGHSTGSTCGARLLVEGKMNY